MLAILPHLLNLTLNIYGHNIKLVKVLNYYLLQIDEKAYNLVVTCLTCQNHSWFWYSSLLSTDRGDPTNERKKIEKKQLENRPFFLFSFYKIMSGARIGQTLLPLTPYNLRTSLCWQVSQKSYSIAAMRQMMLVAQRKRRRRSWRIYHYLFVR